jgi:cell division protein FtsQ
MGVYMREKKHNTNLRIMKFLAVCFVAAVVVFAVLVTCRLKKVIIVGSNHYSSEEIKDKIITKTTDHNTILLYLRYKYGDKVNIPFVEDIDIELVDKNTVKIHVYEKVITGCIEFMSEYMYFDKDGIVVESSDKKLDDIPFITGLKFQEIVLYDKLKIKKDALFDVILNLTQLIQKYELDIEKINFNSDYEVTLYHGDIQVFLGKRDTYDEQLAELKNLLPSAEGKKLILDMKNFTEGQDKIIAKPMD